MPNKFSLSERVIILGLDGTPKIKGGIVKNFDAETENYSLEIQGRNGSIEIQLPEERLLKETEEASQENIA